MNALILLLAVVGTGLAIRPAIRHDQQLTKLTAKESK